MIKAVLLVSLLAALSLAPSFSFSDSYLDEALRAYDQDQDRQQKNFLFLKRFTSRQNEKSQKTNPSTQLKSFL